MLDRLDKPGPGHRIQLESADHHTFKIFRVGDKPLVDRIGIEGLGTVGIQGIQKMPGEIPGLGRIPVLGRRGQERVHRLTARTRLFHSRSLTGALGLIAGVIGIIGG